MAYPSAVDSYTTKVDDVDDVMAAHVNDLQTAVVNIETELGTDPAGTAADVKTRLAVSIAADGDLDLTAGATLTISGGSVTCTNNFHILDTQGSASTDDLDTIVDGNVDGYILVLRIAADARNVVLKHNTGNIYCPASEDITLDFATQLALLMYDNTLGRWLVITVANCPLLNGANVFTDINYFSNGMRHQYTALSADTTLNNTHYQVNVDASGGAKTITLPAAATCTGIVYKVKKADSSANAVTVDADSTETIDGKETQLLYHQYDTIEVQSTGTAWIIVNRRMGNKYTVVGAITTLDDTYETVDVTDDGGQKAVGSTPITINLPPIATYPHIIYHIRNQTGYNMVTITPNGSEKINGESSYKLICTYDAVTLQASATEWIVL